MKKNQTKKCSGNRFKKFSIVIWGVVGIICCLCISISSFAESTSQENNDIFNLRYLSPEDIAVTDYLAKQKGPDIYFDGLKSDDIYKQYISINKLFEYFNDEGIRPRAVTAITPFLDSKVEKISNAASFALSILKEDYNNPDIYRLSDGAVIFTPFNNYSDYGSYNQVWMIKDNQLTKIIDYRRPMMYITQIILSPSKTQFAVISCSNKSQYMTVYLENKSASPELVDSSRFMVARDKGFTVWQRADFENYSGIDSCRWIDDDNIEFKASLAFNETGKVEQAVITYNVKDEVMNYELTN